LAAGSHPFGFQLNSRGIRKTDSGANARLYGGTLRDAGSLTDPTGELTDDPGAAMAEREFQQIRLGSALAEAGTMSEHPGVPPDDPRSVRERPGTATKHPGTVPD